VGVPFDRRHRTALFPTILIVSRIISDCRVVFFPDLASPSAMRCGIPPSSPRKSDPLAVNAGCAKPPLTAARILLRWSTSRRQKLPVRPQHPPFNTCVRL